MIKPVSSVSEAWYELLSSMRFAISLLTIMGITAVIGTVLAVNMFLTGLHSYGML